MVKNLPANAGDIRDVDLIPGSGRSPGGGQGKEFPAFQEALVVKNLPANAGDIRDVGLIPGSGRSPGGAHGNPLQGS